MIPTTVFATTVESPMLSKIRFPAIRTVASRTTMAASVALPSESLTPPVTDTFSSSAIDTAVEVDPVPRVGVNHRGTVGGSDDPYAVAAHWRP